jgi:hypothetical protein
MKRAGQDDLENEQSENSYNSEEESDDVPNSSLAPSPAPNTATAARPGTGGKQPVSGKPPPPRTVPNTGGKQPLSQSSIEQQRTAAIQKTKTANSNNSNTTNSNAAAKPTGTGASTPASTGGKNPGVYAKNSQNAGTQRQQNTPAARSGIGGKEPVNTHKNIRHQPASKSSQHSAGKARSQTSLKPHHLIGKMVKVFYVPEGYFTGVVKSQIGESEFMIHWDDGSTTSAVLRDEDETEDADNEDRWSIVEDIPYESIVPVNNDKAGNGARSKQITPQKPIAPAPQPPQPAAQPAAFEEEEDDNGHDNENEDNDNENEENEENDNYSET